MNQSENDEELLAKLEEQNKWGLFIPVIILRALLADERAVQSLIGLSTAKKSLSNGGSG